MNYRKQESLVPPDLLQVRDEVVAKAGAYVRDGDKVNPVKAEQASATK